MQMGSDRYGGLGALFEIPTSNTDGVKTDVFIDLPMGIRREREKGRATAEDGAGLCKSSDSHLEAW